MIFGVPHRLSQADVLSRRNTGPDTGTSEAGLPAERVPIQPEALVQKPDLEDPRRIIPLPKLETTQCFLNALGTVSLESSGMQPEDIDNLQNPGPVFDLVDPSPLLRCLRHFINNNPASRAHYDGIHEIELLHNPLSEFLSFDQVKRCLR